MLRRFAVDAEGATDPTIEPVARKPAQDRAAQDAAARLRQFDTNDVPETERRDTWQHVVGELIGDFELRDCNPAGFRSAFGLATVAGLKICHFTGVSQTLHRKAGLIKSSDTDDFLVALESSRTFNLEQNGHRHSGRDGITLVDTAQPFHANHPEALDVIGVFVPRPMMEGALGSARHAAGLSVDASVPSFSVVAAFLRALRLHGESLDPASAARLSSIAVELIASCFAEKMGRTPAAETSSAAVLCRAQAYIADNLGVAGLGMQEVASVLNMSVRRLHQIAADERISLVDWMWERRLLQARAMLADPAHRQRSVGTVAYQCGFVDPAHFSRRFKLRFGKAPSELRAPATAGASA